MQQNHSQSTEIERKITVLTQQREALLRAMGILQKKIVEQKQAFSLLSQRTEEFYISSLQSNQLALQELLENEPAVDERDAKAKRQLNPYRVSSPIEQQIEMMKGGVLTRLVHTLICHVNPSYGMVKAVQIRNLRQQARREWEAQVRPLEREIKDLKNVLQFPRYTDEQRSLLAATASDERERSRLEQLARGKEIEIASLKPQVGQAQVDSQARAKEQSDRAATSAAYNQVAQNKLTDDKERRQENKARRVLDAQIRQQEEAARRIILQAQIDEALARKQAAEMMRDAVLQRAAGQAGGQPQTGMPSTASARKNQDASGTGHVIVSEVLVIESGNNQTY